MGFNIGHGYAIGLDSPPHFVKALKGRLNPLSTLCVRKERRRFK